MNINFSSINFSGHFPNSIINKKAQKSSVIANNAFLPHNERGQISELGLNLISEIRELFEFAHSTIKSIAKSSNTRSSVKNGYPGLKRGIAGSRILKFEKIGNNGEDISINLHSEHKKHQLTVISIDDNPFVINTHGQIEKNPTLQFIGKTNVREKGDTLKFFSQQEVDRLNIENHLFALRQELKKYTDYIINRKKEINKIREQKKDNKPGTLDKYKSLIKTINKNFRYFKTNLEKLSYKGCEKNTFRILNKIKTIQRNAILFKDATCDGRSLYLVYSKIKFKDMIKILLMDYNNKTVDKSFIIFENKLAKFNPKTVTQRPKHPEYDFHYYTQEEINNSNLDTYLNIISNRLKEINEKLHRGIKERFSK